MEQVEGQIIEEKDIIVVTPEQPIQPEKECKTCKQKTLTPVQWGIALLGMYLIFASVYGTIKLIKDITSYFGY